MINTKRGKYLKPYYSSKYPVVALSVKGVMFRRLVHRLVLEAFVGPRPKGMECRHLDSNSLNNNVSNLMWGTHKENEQDKIKHGNSLTGEKHPMSKLTEQDVRTIIYICQTGLFTQKEVANMYGVLPTQVSNILCKRNWKHIWRN